MAAPLGLVDTAGKLSKGTFTLVIGSFFLVPAHICLSKRSKSCKHEVTQTDSISLIGPFWSLDRQQVKKHFEDAFRQKVKPIFTSGHFDQWIICVYLPQKANLPTVH